MTISSKRFIASTAFMLIAAALLILQARPAAAQQFTVTGTVTSASDGDPLPGATILEVGTQSGTSTDVRGRFTLDVSNPNATIAVSYIGFLTKRVEVNGEDVIAVALAEDVGQLEEVVVTAFGIERQQRALGYSVSQVSGESLRESRENNVANSLSGKIAGVVVSKPATGSAGSSNITIRGNTSLGGDNQPLYVVDGIPIDNSTAGQAGMWGGADEGDGIQSINPDDIENISVLKGPAAAALYGTRAQNGVVLITTKTGRSHSNMLGVEFNSNTTFEDALVGYHDFQDIYGQGTRGEAPTSVDEALSTGSSSWGARLDPSRMVVQFDGVQRPYGLVENPMEEFYETGITATNTLSLTGGVGGTTFRASGSVLNGKDIFPEAGIDRYNLSLRGTSNFGSKLSTDVKIAYMHQDVPNRSRLSDSPGNGNLTIGILPRNVNPKDLAPGHRADDPLREQEFDTNVFSTNPYWAAERFRHTDKEHRFNGFGLMRYQLLDWVSVQARVGQDWGNKRFTSITPFGTAFSLRGNMSERNRTILERNWDFLIAADRRLTSDFGVNATVGGNRMDRVFEQLSMSGSNFNIPDLQTIGNTTSPQPGYGFSQKRINSVYGSAEFSFRDFIFLTATARNDWSSTLPEENNSYFYPSLSGSFVFSDALQMPSWVTFGKIRGSWAQVGGDTDPYRLTLPFSLAAGGTLGSLGYVASDQIPLAGLKPSQSEGVEAGFEVRFMDNRLGLDFTWYKQNTTNQILGVTVPRSSGFGSKVINAGEMENRGVEAMLNTTPVRTANVRWDVDFNFAKNTNEVVELTEGMEFLNLQEARAQNVWTIAQVGESFNTLRGYRYKRDDAGNIVMDANGLPMRGELEILGNGLPDWTGGILNTVRYKNVTMSALIDVSWGGDLYSGTNRGAYATGLHKNTLAGRDVCDQVGWDEPCWVAPGVKEDGSPNDVAIYPQSYFGRLAAFGTGITEEFIYDATYVKLREFQLRYRIPSRWIQGSPVQLATVSLVARNLWLIHKNVPNVDPESAYNVNNGGRGLEWYGVPQTRSIGFNVNFRL